MKSMTGFGNASRAFPEGRVTVDVRAVNHRFLEIKLHLPRGFIAVEDACRSMIASRIERGRIEVFVSLTGRAAQSYRVVPNVALAREYTEAATRLQRALGVDGELDLQFLTSRPDVLRVTEAQQAPRAETDAVGRALRAALVALERHRRREGRFLARDLRQRIRTLERLRREVERRSRHIQPARQQKLVGRVGELLTQLDVETGRGLHDVVGLVQKNDLTEELVRLHSHLETFAELFGVDAPVGKRMDFLLQEIQREVNTIGAKADDAPIRHLVVQAKEEVEKIREQVQNIE